MNILFVHQNFPGQYKYLMPYLSRTGHKVIGIGEEHNLKDNQFPNDLDIRTYPTTQTSNQSTHHYIRAFEEHIRKGQGVLKACLELRTKDNFIPDLICVHTGWGEASFLRDIFPHAKILALCEYFYDKQFLGNIEAEHFSMDFDALLRFRVQNSTQLLSATNWDWGTSPTHFQWNTYPDFLQKKISIIHDGIDTDILVPKKTVKAITLPNGEIIHKDTHTIITYVSRNLEPYRGFHTFVKAIPYIQKAMPDAHILLIGGDGVSYGRPAPAGTTYREMFMKEVEEDINPSKVHFLGRLSYDVFTEVLYNSHIHTYLSYPFVLSWSMLEAMSMGLLIVASDTPSVTEAIQDGYNGILCDFYNPQDVAEKIIYAHKLPENTKEIIKKHARESAIKKYDLRTHCLPKQLELINILTAGGIPKAPGFL